MERQWLADVERANEIAERLSLTGKTRDSSLQLSNPFNKARPAPWAEGLSLVLLQANEQLKQKREPTCLLLWVFIPDSQVFHFIEMNGEFQWMKLDSDTMDVPKVTELASKLKIDFKDTGVDLDVAYVWHNRDVEKPTSKSQVLGIWGKGRDIGTTITRIFNKLMDYPWLRNYVKFGERALKQLLKDGPRRSEGPNSEKSNDMRAWLEKESHDVDE